MLLQVCSAAPSKPFQILKVICNQTRCIYLGVHVVVGPEHHCDEERSHWFELGVVAEEIVLVVAVNGYGWVNEQVGGSNVEGRGEEKHLKVQKQYFNIFFWESVIINWIQLKILKILNLNLSEI